MYKYPALVFLKISTSPRKVVAENLIRTVKMA